MSHILIGLSPDLKRLRDEGYEIEVKNGYLLVHHVPYVNSRSEIAYGVLVTPLGDLAGDRTARPSDHVIFFYGEHPCKSEGGLIQGIQHSSETKTLSEGIIVNHSFSSKPPNGYSDYYEKVTTYLKIIESQAQAINSSVTAQTFIPVESTGSASPFKYVDANSSRAEIDVISSRLLELKIAIVGLGGTGSYVLDFVAKTPVKEIHLFDGDEFLTHNSFRTPGAASLEALREKPKKVTYLHTVYSHMRNNLIPHVYHLTDVLSNELVGMNFVFICIDNGESKKLIIQKLMELEIPFVDVGIGIDEVDGLLRGSARITLITHQKNDHVEKRISFSDQGGDEYGKNIQIAEINALNAALAVIKWKKLFGFYHDNEKEHNSVYDISTNRIINDEIIS